MSEFFPSLISDPKNSWAHIESLLVAYRYFKECRNSFIHKGGFADQKAVDAYNAMTGIPHTTLGLEKPLNVPRVELGKRIRLDLQDAVGFSNIVHRIIRTLDAALAVSDLAEIEIVRRVQIKYKGKRTIGQQPAKRQRRLLAMMRGAGLPRPVATTLLEQLLIQNNLVV